MVSSSFRGTPRVKLLCALVASCFAAESLANPTGPAVAAGAASFNTVGKTLTVTNTPNAIINWKGFSIGAGEMTRFQQQGASSAVLNRVVGQDPSAILGTLSSNGKVFLINPNGVLFGQGSRIDVAGLVASTLSITDRDFLAGRLNFQAGAVAGSIVNQGEIVSASGGRIYLIAPDVQNHGLISSPSGEVVLAAGRTVSLVDADVPNLKVEVQAGGEALNVGKILADGGKVGIYAGLINQRGIVRADSVAKDATGKIVFKASDTTILDEGSVTSAAGAKGGEIQVLGNKVGLVGNAAVDASGDAGGGTVLIGGDYQGKNAEVQNALRTYVGPDAMIKADAITGGDGGKVIVWADETTRFHGSISARGGSQSGNGGFVETSGKEFLYATGRVNASAPAGAPGKWLLDPRNVTIGASTLGGIFSGGNPDIFTPGSDDAFVDAAVVSATLSLGTSVTITTGATGTQDGDITVASPLNWFVPLLLSPQSLTLTANRNINVNADITGVFTTTNGSSGSINLNAGGRLAVASGTTVSLQGNDSGGGANSVDIIGIANTFDIRGIIHAHRTTGNGLGSASVSLRTTNGASAPSIAIDGGQVLATGPVSSIITLDAFSGAAPDIAITNGTVIATSDSGGTAQVGLSGATINIADSEVSALFIDSGNALSTVTMNATGALSISGNSPIEAYSGTNAQVNITAGGNLSIGGSASPVLEARSNTTVSMLLQSTSGDIEIGGNILADAGIPGTAFINFNAPAGAITSIGGGILQSPSTGAEFGLSAQKGIGTVANPIRVDNNNIDLAATNTATGDLAVSVVNGDVTLVPGDLINVLNSNPTGTYLVKAETGNILLSMAFKPGFGSPDLVAGQSVIFKAPVGNVTLDSAGSILATGTGNVTLEAGNHLSLAGPGLQVTGNNVTFLANDMNIVGGATATTSATLAASSTTQNIDLGTLPLGGGPLSISPAELKMVTAPMITIGRTDSTSNILYLNQPITASDVNATTLQLQAFDIYENGNGGITASGNLTLRAGRNITLAQNSLIVPDNRNLNIFADSDNQNGVLNIGGVTLQVGAGSGNTTGQMTLQGRDINAIVSGGGSTVVRVTGSGSQSITATNDFVVQNDNTTGAGSILVEGGTQTINVGNLLKIAAGTGTNTTAIVRSNGAQTVDANTLDIRGGNAGTGNDARLRSLGTASDAQNVTANTMILTGGADGGGLGVGNNAQMNSDGGQDITVGAGGLTMTARGNPLSAGTTDSAAIIYQIGTSRAQTVTVNSGGFITLTGGDTPLTGVGSSHGSRALLLSDGTSQTINFTAGGAINLTGGTTGSRNFAQIVAMFGSQTITGSPATTLTGGSSGGIDGEGNFARIYALGTQNLNLSTLFLGGGPGGTENFAQILQDGTTGTQTIAVPVGGIHLKGGLGGGGFDTGNFAQIRANGSQVLNVTGGMLLEGGSGALTDNFASVFQSLATGTQSINMNGGGTLELRAGSTAQSGIGTVSGHGSFAFVTNEGTAQSIHFASGGAIDIRGGTVGSRNNAGILARNGSQSITGSPNILLTGGASGGVADEGNSASIQATVGSQFIEAGNLTLQAGAAGINNFAVVQSPIQDIFVQGNLSLAGGGSAASATSGGGARIGGMGGASPTPTDLVLIVDGSLTMTGGSVANAGTTIGNGITGGQATDMLIDVGGNVTLNPGTVANGGSRIGSPASGLAGGDISIIAGGTVALNSNPGLGTFIRTLGNVSINAASITQGADSAISAGGTLTTVSSGSQTLNGMNTVASLDATTGGGSLHFTNSTTLDVLNGATSGGAVDITVSSGDLNIPGTIDAGTGGVTLVVPTGTVNGTGSSPDITGGTLNITAGNIIGSGGLHLSVPQINSLVATAGQIDVFSFTTATLQNAQASGSIALNSTAPLTIAGPVVSASGQVTINSPATSFAGNVSLTNYTFGSSTTLQSGTLNLAGTTTVPLGTTVAVQGGTLNASSGTVNVAGTMQTTSGSVSASTVNLNGSFDASGGAVTVGTLNVLSGGTLSGSGTIVGNVNNSAGIVSPGASPGILTIQGNYIQGPSGVLDMQIGVPVTGTPVAGTDYDQLKVIANPASGAIGSATLGGTLNTTLVGTSPATGTAFMLVDAAGGISGTFTTVNSPVGSLFNSFYGPTTFEFVAAASAVLPPPLVVAVNNVIVSTEQLSQPLVEVIDTIVVTYIEPVTTTTPEGQIVPKPPACN